MSSNTDKERERLLSSPVRLRIMATLLSSGTKEFTEMIEILELTKGNLSSHIKQLNDAGYVDVTKNFVKNRPCTKYSLTEKGAEAFETHISILESIISQSKGGLDD